MATHTDHTRQPATIARQSEVKQSRKTKQVDRYLADRALAKLMREVNGR